MARRYSYDLSRYHITSMDMDYLYPVGIRECVPGDVFRIQSHAFIRCTPMVNPVMHPLHATIHHWFVPYRLLNSYWKYFISEDEKHNGEVFDEIYPERDNNIAGPDDNPKTDGDRYERKFPSFYLENDAQRPDGTWSVGWFPKFGPGSLADRMGFKVRGSDDGRTFTASGNGISSKDINAMPFLAYRLLWNEFYRDPDVDALLKFPYVWDRDVQISRILKKYKDFFDLQRVSTPKDYFSTARPFSSASRQSAFVNVDLSEVSVDTSKPNTSAPLDGMGTFNMLDLREAGSLQRFFEHRLRQGYDYTRYLRSCGVSIHNDFCERPVYLGGSKSTIQFSDVVQTVGTDNAPLGSLGGYGTGNVKARRIKYFAKEHGFIMTLMSIVPTNVYTMQIDPLWFKTSRFDYYTKELENIGMTPLDNREFGLYGNNDFSIGTFGYKDMYEEYRSTYNRVSGEFNERGRDNNIKTRGNYWNWTMAKYFTSTPKLNASFMASNSRKTPFVDVKSDAFQVMYFEDVKAKRRVIPRPKYQII